MARSLIRTFPQYSPTVRISFPCLAFSLAKRFGKDKRY